MRAYELVPEAYRQKFREMRKRSDQNYTEFAQKLSVQFKRWCTASEIESEEALRQLILIEQFKNGLPTQIATYISKHQVATVSEAATLADDYALVHKTGFYGTPPFRYDRGYRGGPPERHGKSEGASRPASTFETQTQSKWDCCNYCLGIATGNLSVRC